MPEEQEIVDILEELYGLEYGRLPSTRVLPKREIVRRVATEKGVLKRAYTNAGAAYLAGTHEVLLPKEDGPQVRAYYRAHEMTHAFLENHHLLTHASACTSDDDRGTALYASYEAALLLEGMEEGTAWLTSTCMAAAYRHTDKKVIADAALRNAALETDVVLGDMRKHLDAMRAGCESNPVLRQDQAIATVDGHRTAVLAVEFLSHYALRSIAIHTPKLLLSAISQPPKAASEFERLIREADQRYR